MTSCGGKLVSIGLTLFNLLWMVVGVLLFYFGYNIFTLENDSFQELVSSNMRTGSLVLISLGLIILVVSLIGFCGSCCGKPGLLNFYGFIIFLVLCINIGMVYYGGQYKEDFIYQFNKGIEKGISQFDNDPKLAFTLQSIQSTFECCGWEGPGDYGILEVPSSCCGLPLSKDNPRARCSRFNIKYSYGCKNSPIIQNITSKVEFSFYVLIFLEILLILASCCLARDLRED